ncbi:MAG: hypothetical protein U0103_03075 [Candidatus Obscuribacterales bacterium]
MTEISSSDSLIKADDKKSPPPEKHPTPSASAPRVGDGAHNDTSGGGTHESSEDAFRAAIGLESGNRGNTRYTTEQFNRDVGQGEGISRGQVVKYTDANGNTIQGGQYHNRDGTFFKTPEGDTYKVQTENGRYTLQPQKEGQQPIEATQRDVVSNNFGRWGNRRNGDNDASSGQGDKPAVDKPAADKPAVVAPAVAPAVAPERVVAPSGTDKTLPVVNTTGGVEHAVVAAPAAAPAAAPKLDPAAFYNSFKGANDQQQRELLTSSLSQLPKEQQRDFIRQVAEVGIKTDRANAGDVINDLRQTAHQVRSTLESSNSSQPAAPAGTDKQPAAPAGTDKQPALPAGTDKQPAAPAGTDKQPAVSIPAAPVKGDQSVQPGQQPLPARLDGGALKPDNMNQGGQWVKGNGDNQPGVRPNPGGNDGQPVRSIDTAKVVTAVEGVILKDGNKGNLTPGGDNGALRGLPGQPGQGPIDPAVLAQKLQNPGMQPVDRVALGGDGKPFQPVQLPPDLTRGHGGDGKDNPGVQIAARGAGGDQPQPALPQRNGIPGLDMNDPQTRQFLADALKQIQSTKMGDFDPRSQSQNLQDILKGFDPHKVDRLQAFLNPDGKGPITDAAVGRLASLMTQPGDRVAGAIDITQGQKLAIDRLTDLVRNNQNLIDLQSMQIRDARLMQEINRLVGDVNKQFGFEGKNVLTLGDIIGRSLDGTRGGERGLEGKSALAPTNLDPLTFTARLTPQQEQAMRALLDMKDGRLANQDTHANQRQTDLLGKNEPGIKVDTTVKAELANKGEQKPDGKHELTAKELAAGKELPVKDAQGRDLSGKDLAGKELAAKDLTGKELAGKSDKDVTGKDLGVKAELGVKGELGAKGEMPGRLDQIIRPESKDGKDERGDKLDPHSPFGKHDGLGNNLDGKKGKDDKELAEKQKDEKERLEEEQQRREAALLALMADRKVREDKEKQQKEQEKLKDKKQDEDARRRRYVVRERDTLESIASKQHRDAKLAPLIHEINKKEIAMKVENGREVPDLRARQVIWLPSEVDIREFRKRLHSGSSAQSAGDEKLSAEEELAARFGANWDGTISGDATESGASGGDSSAPSMTPEQLAAAQARRANIEKLLGPIAKQRPADGRIRYVVRLGDTLKTVAMKHPSLQDISLWPLLAEINDISVETDQKGTPLAKLSRGSTILIPTAHEVEYFREHNGIKASSGARPTKACPQCGRLSAVGAAICGACAHSFNLDARPSAASDAGMVVIQAAGFVQKPGVPLAKRPAPPETVELEPAPVLPPPLYDAEAQVAVVQLDEQTRLTRCMVHGDNPSTVVVVEVSRDNAWKSVVAYEIFAQSSMRHEYSPRGDRKSVRIDLPTEAILELSNNDLKTNWKNYRDRYFAQLISLNR